MIQPRMVCLALVIGLLPIGCSDAPDPGSAAVAPAVGEAGSAKAEFADVLKRWKALVADLVVLRAKYRDGDEQQRSEIRLQWQEFIEKGDSLEPKLLAAAEKAYAQAPNTDKEVTNLVLATLRQDIDPSRLRPQTEDYERALRIGRLLSDNKFEDKRYYDLVGRAAFAMCEFDDAEKFLKLAKANIISEKGKQTLSMVAACKNNWQREQKLRAAEAAAAEADKLPRVLLKTNRGDLVVELFENEAPNTVANFISLVEKGFYDGLTFHRVLPGFMAQSGCPKGDGEGGPGYEIPCESYKPERRRHFRGSLSMALAGRDTGGSQFFITFMPTPQLDNPPPQGNRHTVFGRVVEGLDLLHKIKRRDPEGPNPPKPDKIIEATVLNRRDHEYVPEKMTKHE